MKFTAKTDCTLLELILAHHPGMSNSKAKKMIENYKVKCGESILKRPVDAVLKGQVVEFLQREAIKTVKVDDFRLRIVYEDKWLIVAHKPFGIVSSGDTLKEGQTLFTQIRSYLRSKYGMREQLFVVHRLDKAVEGLIMFARSEAVKEKLQENWKQVSKFYVAQTTAIPKEKSGTIHSWLREEEHMKMVSYEQEVPESKEAITHYRVLKTMGQYALIEIKLETGRKNQIRIHLSSIGCPIVGDRRYNDDDRTVKSIKLLSYKLEFVHPVTGQPMKFSLPIPKNFENAGGR
jgi:23S rRNA pseudouridine1911/1915/1917 synthase